jgi:hypothetical protein
VIRPDFSEFIVHFTKTGPPICDDTRQPNLERIRPLSAKERLFSILELGTIQSTNMPWTNKKAVCFTECTWTSLLFHAERYSPYGIGFHKSYIFSCDGGPAIYLPPSLMQMQKDFVGRDRLAFEPHLFAFMTPFVPDYAPREYIDKYWEGKPRVDYSHEREWRVPHDLIFSMERVAFIIVNSYKDMATAPRKFKDAIGRNNWLIMSNYRQIEEIWPTHKLE